MAIGSEITTPIPIPTGISEVNVWDSTITYTVGSIVRGTDGNYYRGLTATANHNPTTDSGTNWELEQVIANTILAVPSRFSTLATAWAFLRNARIGATVLATIQLADGTYTLTSRVTYNHPHGDRIAILGNVTTPANCILSATGLTSPGANDSFVQKTDGLFSVSDGHILGLLSGFKMVGPGVATSLRLTGILAFNGARIIIGNVWVTDFGREICAINHSYIYGDTIRASNGGDGNFFVYNGSTIACPAAIGEGASNFYSQSGACVEFGSNLWAPNGIFRLNGGCQIAVDYGSSLFLVGATFESGGGFDSAPAIKCFGGVFSQQRGGNTYTNCSESQYEINIDTSIANCQQVFGFRTGSEANFAEFAFVAMRTNGAISICQPNVATGFFGFADGSSALNIATDSSTVEVKVGSSKTFGGTTVQTSTATSTVFPGQVMMQFITLVPGAIPANNSFSCDGTHAYYIDGSGSFHQLD